MTAALAFLVSSALTIAIGAAAEAALEAAALARAKEMGLQGMTVDLGEPVVVKLRRSGYDPSLAEAEIDPAYFPFAFHAVAANGKAMRYDPRVDRTAREDPFGAVHAFDVRGQRVYACPYQTPSAALWLAETAAVVEHVTGPEIPAVSAELVKRASQALAATVREMGRQMDAAPEE